MDHFYHHRRAKASIAQGALTNSKRPECMVNGVYPTHLLRGQGGYVFDTSNKRYADYICGLGSNILGYSDSYVNTAVISQLTKGVNLSLSTVLEVETAETLKGLFPFVDAVKFLKTGSEACAAAVRIARAKTGRVRVLSAGYHGWQSEFVSLTPPALGIPTQVGIFSYEPGLLDSDTAAVIVEPVMTDYSRERVEWLKDLRERCTKYGALLIFDEIITGFRFPRFSVSNYWGIEPDLICLGKAMANGHPISAVGGKYTVMNCGEYFVSSTFAGETVSLAAAKATMEALRRKFDLSSLWEKGEEFLSQFNAIWPEKIQIVGYPTRGVFRGDPLVKALLWQEACRAGILFGPSWFFNFPLIEQTFPTISTCRDILTRIKSNQVTLQGEMPLSPFSQRARERDNV